MGCRTAGWPSRWLLLAVALPLAGCSALPVIAVDARSSASVQVEAANGRVLSASKSKALLDRLGVGGAESSSFERHLALEQEISGSPLSCFTRRRQSSTGCGRPSARPI